MNCHICESDKVRQYLKVKGFDIYRCGDCLTQFVNPMPSVKEAESYAEWDKTQEKALRNPYYGWLTFGRQARTIKRMIPEGRILDYGCGGGHFLTHMGMKWNRYGIEVSPEAREVAENAGASIFGVEGLGMFVDSVKVFANLQEFRIKDGYFNVITMFAVIEHLPNPQETVAELSKLLKAGGLFVVMTGDVESPKAKYKKEKWHMYCPPLHLYFFSAKAVDSMMSNLGFRKVKSLYTDGGMLKMPFIDLAYPLLRGLPLFDHYYSYWVKE